MRMRDRASRSSARRGPSSCTRSTWSRDTATPGPSTFAAARAPTSGPWRRRSARPSAAARTSPRCAARERDRSTCATRTRSTPWRRSTNRRANEKVAERVMDSNDLERERGITILAKNCAVEWKGTHVNIVDTPGHADFGGEVERVLSMVDSVLLLVDAVEGPMPQTRFVTRKALALGLKPIVVVNKIDRPGARPEWVINATFELFDKLGATEEQLDFPVIYASALLGWATTEKGATGTDLAPLFDAILEHVPAHQGSPDDPLQLQICSLDYSTYVGRIGIGRVNQGTLRPMQDVAMYSGPDSTPIKARVNQVLKFEGLERQQATEAGPGDIVLINGIEGIGVGVTITSLEDP